MKLLRVLTVLVLASLMLAGAVAGLAFWHFSRGLPDYQQLADYQPPIVTRIYAGDGRLLGEYASERRVFVPIGAIPPRVIHAFLAAEDKNFYDHPGVDFVSILRAGVTNLSHLGSNRRPIGASTITQQVAKNFLLTNEVSVSRKVKEILLALRIDKALPKDRILELYLNEIYLGGGSYGVAAAALYYFNKPLDELTIAEAAFLGALPKAPNNYNPQRFPDAAKARRDWVAGRMAEDGYISAEDAAAASAGPVAIRKRDEAEGVAAPYFAEEVRRELLSRYGEKGLYQSGMAVRTSLNPELQAFADRALRQGLQNYDRRHGWRGPIGHIEIGQIDKSHIGIGQIDKSHIDTGKPGDWQPALAALALPAGAGEWRLAVVLGTDRAGAQLGLADGSRALLPFEAMKWARRLSDEEVMGPVPKTAADVAKPGDVLLVEIVSRADAKHPAVCALRQIPKLSGALVAMDPHTGRVLAMSGGFSYEISQFDRATQAKRQPGSAFKPFVYMAALDNGFTPSTLVLDAPFVVDQGEGMPKWKPSNYDEGKFSGPTPLRIGIEQSKNLMTARLGQVVGLDKVAEYVERFGVMDHMPLQYAMLLGAGETTPLRLVTAYSMIVNGGKRVAPVFVDRIQDRDGKTVFRADSRPCGDCVTNSWNGQAPPELPDTRAQVIDPGTAYQMVSILQGVVERGTGTAVKAVGKPLAGKTGTTNDYQDNWFVGFAPDLAVGVYVGFDNPESLGEKETGGHNAAPIFRDFMIEALKDKPATPFRIPPGLRLVRVNPATGRQAEPGDKTVIFEAFKPGTEPGSETSVVNGIAAPDDGLPVGESQTGPASMEPANSAPVGGTGGLY